MVRFKENRSQQQTCYTRAQFWPQRVFYLAKLLTISVICNRKCKNYSKNGMRATEGP